MITLKHLILNRSTGEDNKYYHIGTNLSNQFCKKCNADNCLDMIALTSINGEETIRDAINTLLFVRATRNVFGGPDRKLHYHREDGPAIIQADGTKQYWLDGMKLDKKSYLAIQKETINWKKLMAQELGQKENN